LCVGGRYASSDVSSTARSSDRFVVIARCVASTSAMAATPTTAPATGGPARTPTGDPFLLTPGPLTTSLATKQAMVHDWGSRDPAFIALNRRIRDRLVRLVDGDGTHTAVLLQGSGTFAVEATVGTLVPRTGTRTKRRAPRPARQHLTCYRTCPPASRLRARFQARRSSCATVRTAAASCRCSSTSAAPTSRSTWTKSAGTDADRWALDAGADSQISSISSCPA